MIFKIMTRKEIIEEAASKYIEDYSYVNVIDDVSCGFMDGAEWADKHPSEELISKLYSISIAVYKQFGKPDKEAIEYIKNHLKL